MKKQSGTSESSPVDKAQHTKSKWFISDINDTFGESGGIAIDAIDPKDGLRFEICEVWGINKENIHSSESRANARLIAAAPDLLFALEGLLTIKGITTAANHEGLINCALIAQARAAIHKATGK